MVMPTYIMLTKLTDEGCKTLSTKPERVKEVNADVEKMGGKVLKQYAVLGVYDFINILEAPDNETIGRISVQLASRGTLRIETYPLMEVESFISKLK